MNQLAIINLVAENLPPGRKFFIRGQEPRFVLAILFPRCELEKFPFWMLQQDIHACIVGDEISGPERIVAQMKYSIGIGPRPPTVQVTMENVAEIVRSFDRLHGVRGESMHKPFWRRLRYASKNAVQKAHELAIQKFPRMFRKLDQ